jgi:choline-glycine betaine transporter
LEIILIVILFGIDFIDLIGQIIHAQEHPQRRSQEHPQRRLKGFWRIAVCIIIGMILIELLNRILPGAGAILGVPILLLFIGLGTYWYVRKNRQELKDLI